MKRQIGMLLAALAGSLVGTGAWAADVSGSWRAEIDTPIGLLKYIYTFQLDGEKLTGKATVEVDGQKREVALTECKIVGDTLTFAEQLQFDGMDVRIEYTGKFGENEIKFTRKVGDFAVEEFVARRIQAAAGPSASAP